MMSQHQRCRYALLVLLLTLTGAAWAAEQGGVHLRFSLTDSADDEEVEVSVSGKITDAKTGQGIGGALVRGHIVVWRYQGPELFKQCPSQEVRTDKNGEYKLRFVTLLTTSGPMKGKDSICIDASNPGHETRPLWLKQRLEPEDTTFTDIDIALGPGKLLKGTVVDEDNRPIPEALVRVQNGRSGALNYFGSLGETYTDEKGRFGIWCSTDEAEVTSTAPWLRVSKRGYGVEYFWDLLKRESMGTLTVPRGGTIRGKVSDLEGNPVVGCALLARDSRRNEIDESVTDEQGEYELRGVPGEAVLARFYQRKNGRKPPGVLINTTVYARNDQLQNLRDVPQYVILAKDGETVSGPDLVAGADTSVSGKLIPSKTTSGLQGLMVRLGTSWDHMVEADAEGCFRFPLVRPGKHRLTAYLPNNLRGDRGIGRADIDVEPGKPLGDVTIQLETLAEVRVQFVDAQGNPLEGITGGATWTTSGDGFWTEGTKSDRDGWSVLYLYPGGVQYVRGFDHAGGGLVAEGYEAVEPRTGQVVDNLRIAMVRAATIEGRLLDKQETPVTGRRLAARLEYADGFTRRLRLEVDASGRFHADGVVPGVAQLRVETTPPEMAGSTENAVEIKPGQSTDLGEIRLRILKSYEVSGKLVASPTFSDLEGFKIRLGLATWEPMVATDSQGQFVLPNVREGKHRLTVYLPFNLRTDRGVGRVSINVKDGDLEKVQLPLETLATYQVLIVDESGKPIPGVAAAAWWTADHSGVFTEGTKSDEQGRATLYLYAGQRQYVGAHDWSGKYQLKSHQEVTPKKGAIVKSLTVTMLSGGQEHR
jgi:hypothetical protein